MASNITFNGVTYSIPAVGDDGWGADLSAYFIAIASGALQKTGGNFTLTAEANFGATFGLKSAYVKSQAANPASAGIVRLGNNESISWRNNANNADINLKVNASDSLEFNGASILYGLILNANVDPAAAIALSKLATVTASRVLVSDVSGIITASAITTTTLAFLDATSSIQTQLDAKASSVSLTSHTGATTSVHGIADTSLLITTTGAQVLTNKDFDGGTASNTSRFTIPKAAKATLDALTRKEATLVYASDTDKMYYDDGSILKLVGSGSGGASNLIDDGDAEAGIANFVEGSYTAATRPAGTFTSSSGAGTFAISTSTSSPIFGNTSFLLTKSSGASRQGRAIERTISIDKGYQAKVLEIRINYNVVSGTFVAGSSSADSSLIWYIGQFNGSTWTYTEPSSFKMLSNSTTNSDLLIGNFQTNSDTTQIKLIAYVAETANSAWVVKAEVGINPSSYVYGTPITDWVSWTPTGTWVTNTTYSGFKRRVGDTYEYQVSVSTTGAPTATNLFINLQETMDTAKIIASSNKYLGEGVIHDNGTDEYKAVIIYQSSTQVFVRSYGAGGTYVNFPAVNATQPMTWANTDSLNIRFSAPIVGLSSSTQVSDGYDGRVIGFRANNSSTTINATPAKIVWTNTDKDDVAGYSSGTYTVRSAGWYDVSAALYIGGTPTVDQTSQVLIYRNGAAIKSYTHRYKVALATTTSIGPVADSFYFNAGDTIEIYASSELTSPSISSSTTLNTVFIGKRQAPTTISATEVVAASYRKASAQSVNSAATVKFDTLVVDTHNAYNTTTGVFTAPASGLYEISYQLFSTDSASPWGTSMRVDSSEVVRTQPTTVKSGASSVATNQELHILSPHLVTLRAEQTLDVYISTTAAANTYNQARDNWFSIKRIK